MKLFKTLAIRALSDIKRSAAPGVFRKNKKHIGGYVIEILIIIRNVLRTAGAEPSFELHDNNYIGN